MVDVRRVARERGERVVRFRLHRAVRRPIGPCDHDHFPFVPCSLTRIVEKNGEVLESTWPLIDPRPGDTFILKEIVNP